MARSSSLVLGIAIICALLLASQAANTPLASCARGRSTYYVLETDGACGFGGLRSIYTMAPNEAFFNNSNVCGTCFEVTGPSGSEIFMAADECPINTNEQYCSGDVTHFDLDSRSFNNIAPTSVGVSYTSIREIVCPANGNIGVIVGEVGNSYYLPVYVWNHRVAIAGVSVQDSGSNTAWTTLARTTYNAWVWNPSNAITYPVNYRITSVYGETITTSIPTAPTTTSQLVTGSAQFTTWPTTITENACPTFYEYNIFVNALNDGAGKPTSELWQTTSGANVAYTGTVPSGSTVAARMDIAGYAEWYFETRGTAVPVGTIDSVEIWAYSATTVTGMQLAWNDYGNGNLVSFPSVSSTWTKFTFAKADFGSSLGDLVSLRIKNGNSAAVSGFTIAAFRLIPSTSVVVTPTSSAASPTASTGTPTASSTPASGTPTSTGTTPTATGTTPTSTGTTPTTQSTPTTGTTPTLSGPAVSPSSEAPIGSGSALSVSFALFALIASVLALLY